MEVILDSNIICQDYHLKGSTFKLFLDGLASVPAKLHVPEVVIDEVANRFREDLQEAVDLAKRADSVLSRLLSERVSSVCEGIDSVEKCNEYKAQLVANIKALGGNILPYPVIAHQKIVERDLMRKKPFKRDGSGYRDLLIWESVKRLMYIGEEKVAFITNNTKDFGGGPLVAPELVTELRNPSRLTLFRTLKDFNEAAVLPKLKMMDNLRKDIETQTNAKFDPAKWIASHLIDLLRDHEIGDVALGFPHGVGRFWPKSITDLVHIKVASAREMESSDAFVQLEIKVRINVSIDIDWDDYVNHEEVREWVGENTEPFDWLSTDAEDNYVLEVDLILDKATSEVSSEEITLIDGPYGSIDLSP